jgi:hypothetical protein
MTVFVNLKSFLFFFLFFFLHLILVVHDWLCACIQNNLSGISYVGFRYLSYVFCESAFAVVVEKWRTRSFIHLENRPGLHTPTYVFFYIIV